MSVERVAREHYAERRSLSDSLGRLVARLWASISPASLDGAWAQVVPSLILGLSAAQLATARHADRYASAALAEQGVDGDAEGVLNPAAFAGVASDGRDLAGLLRNPITVVKAGIAGGATVERAMAAGFANLDMLVRTQLADAGRAADQVALAARPAAGGYIRMLSGGSCSRCAILAGRWYAWNDGFLRHPRCDCIHVPAAEDSADDLRTNPRAYFDSLTRAEQDKTFTKAGAEAIREGADIAKVVNARRGMQTATVYGREVLLTTEGTTLRGDFGRARRGGRLQMRDGQRVRSTTAVRLMPEQILREANGDRAEAVRLLKLHGYMAAQPRRAAAPAARPAPAPRPAAVRGRDRLADEARRLDADRPGYDALRGRMKQANFDLALVDIGRAQGFHGLPVVASRSEMDAVVASGWTEVWRGVMSKGSVTPAQVNQRFRTGEYEPGRGLYGNGWYTSVRRNTAEVYRGREPMTNFPAAGGADFEPSELEGPIEPDSMLRIALRPDARVIDYDELVALRDAWLADRPPGSPATGVLTDPGRFAAALGYDAIRVGGNHGDGGFYPGWEDMDDEGGAVQFVILNRTAVMVQRAEDPP